MPSNPSRFMWKSLFAVACLLTSAHIAATASAQPDTILVEMQNESDFAVEKVKLVNQSTSQTVAMYLTLQPGPGVRVLDLIASNATRATQSFELQIDPMGGTNADSDLQACVNFDVTSDNGRITKLEITGPKSRWAVSGKKLAVWDSEDSHPQVVTINARVEGAVDRWRCHVRSIARRGK